MFAVTYAFIQGRGGISTTASRYYTDILYRDIFFIKRQHLLGTHVVPCGWALPSRSWATQRWCFWMSRRPGWTPRTGERSGTSCRTPRRAAAWSSPPTPWKCAQIYLCLLLIQWSFCLVLCCNIPYSLYFLLLNNPISNCTTHWDFQFKAINLPLLAFFINVRPHLLPFTGGRGFVGQHRNYGSWPLALPW